MKTHTQCPASQTKGTLRFKVALLVSFAALGCAPGLLGQGSPIDETINFSTGLPSGWQLWSGNYGSGNFANGRMNAYRSDAFFRINRPLSIPSGSATLTITYRGNTANGSWGGNNSVFIGTSAGTAYEVFHGWNENEGGLFGTQMGAAVYVEGGSRLNSQLMPRTFEEFTYTIIIQNGLIIHRGTRANGTQVFSYAAAVPGLVLANVNRVDLGLYQTALDTLWLDDARIQSAASVAGAGAPTIVSPPQFQSILLGANVSLSVAVSGAPPFTYQWRRNGAVIAGATSSTLILGNALSGDAGSYTVIVTNSFGSVTSNAAILSVPAPLTITSFLGPQAREVGENVVFSISVSAAPPISYQWRQNGLNIPGATNDLLFLPSVQTSDAGSYSVIVSNATGSITSNPALLIVNGPAGFPEITRQPQSQTPNPGVNVVLSVTASGPSPISFQWRKDGTAITGATNETLSINNVQSSDAGNYSVVVSNNSGSVTSDAARLIIATPTTIVTQPTAQTAAEGGNIALRVEVSGTSPFTYQWHRNGVAIPGATGQTLNLSNVSSTDAGAYTVLVAGATGSSATCSAASVTVLAPPSVTISPEFRSVVLGTSTSFMTVTTGNGPFTYQWSKDSRDITGATNATLSINSVSNDDAGTYSVRITASAGTVASRSATLVVGPPRSRLVNISVRTGAGGGNASLIVGFVVAGQQRAAKPVLIRGIGPSLAGFGVGGFLVDPVLDLWLGSTRVAVNDNWGESTEADQIVRFAQETGAFPIANRLSRDAAMLKRLSPAPYTAKVGARTGTVDGIAMVEIYDAESSGATQLVNISARAFVGTGADVLTAGFYVDGNIPKQVLIRGVGPTLGLFGVGGVLADPQLVLNRGSNSVVAANDEWWRGSVVSSSVFASVGAFNLQNESHDAAIVATLDPGSYSVTLSGVGNTTGVALIEIYELPQ